MKRQWLAGIVFLAGIGYLTGMAWKPAPQGPRLEVSPHVQLGMLIHSEERTVRIGFRNSGKQPLTVEALVLGCQCAKPKLDRKSAYEPGETGWFEVTMKPAAPPGSPYQQQVQLESNDPRRPRQLVVVEGKMQSALTVSPARLRVEHAVMGEPWRRKLTIGRAGNGANFQIVALTCTVPGVELSEPAQLSVDERGAYQIEVWHAGAASIGAQSGRIEILTNLPTVPRLLVPVDVQVSSHIKVEPPLVLFRTDDQHEQHVRLTASSAFQLTSTVEDDAWDFQIDSLDETQKSWQVTLRPKTVALDKPQRGTFPLTVNGIGPEHEVSIRYVLLPSSTGE